MLPSGGKHDSSVVFVSTISGNTIHQSNIINQNQGLMALVKTFLNILIISFTIKNKSYAKD